MKNNENSLILKTRKNKLKIKLEKEKSTNKEKRKIFAAIIIPFFIFILIIVIKSKHKFNNNKIDENNIITETKINKKEIGKPKIVAITYGNMFFRRQLELFYYLYKSLLIILLNQNKKFLFTEIII